VIASPRRLRFDGAIAIYGYNTSAYVLGYVSKHCDLLSNVTNMNATMRLPARIPPSDPNGGFEMLKKLTVAVAALALVGAVSTTDAFARGGGGGHGGGGGGGGHFGGGGGFRGGYGGYRGGGYGYGALGLGLGLGYGAYYGYPYAYNGYYGGGCYIVRHRVWTPYGWRFQAYRACG
jgi:hypothetical protein